MSLTQRKKTIFSKNFPEADGMLFFFAALPCRYVLQQYPFLAVEPVTGKASTAYSEIIFSV